MSIPSTLVLSLPFGFTDGNLISENNSNGGRHVISKSEQSFVSRLNMLLPSVCENCAASDTFMLNRVRDRSMSCSTPVKDFRNNSLNQ